MLRRDADKAKRMYMRERQALRPHATTCVAHAAVGGSRRAGEAPSRHGWQALAVLSCSMVVQLLACTGDTATPSALPAPDVAPAAATTTTPTAAEESPSPASQTTRAAPTSAPEPKPAAAGAMPPSADGNDMPKPSDSQPSAAPNTADGMSAFEDTGPAARDTAGPANLTVGTLRIEVDVAANRRVPVQLWYPAVESARTAAEAGRSIVEFEPAGAHRDQLIRIIRAAPAEFTQRLMHAAEAPDVYAQSQALPLILMSHCNDGQRYGLFSVAERLASKGFVVAAPDHVGNTYYDALAGTSVGPDFTFLERRRADILALLDVMLNPGARSVPSGLRGQIDADRIGMVGHSMGGLTTGYTAILDTRIRAIATLAIPLTASADDPIVSDIILPYTKLEDISQPTLFVRASDDMLQAFGFNDIMHRNFDSHPKEAWLVTLQDAGHYSVSDLCGLDASFADGCGNGVRLTTQQPFKFLESRIANNDTARVVSAFLETQLLGANPQAISAAVAEDPKVLSLEHHTP
jgi:hypothetical protein